MMATPKRYPHWLMPGVAFAVVTAVIVTIAIWQPFAPRGQVDSRVVGDADRGATLYAENCSSCHGEAGEGGGAGPSLVRAPRQADAVARVIAAGRGIMPAGIVEGQDVADVAAHVARLSAVGEESGAAPTPPPRDAGQLQLTGDRLRGIFVNLGEPAPANWTVWLDGKSGLIQAGNIPRGQRVLADPDLGVGPVIESFDTVVIGASTSQPALRGMFTASDVAGLTRLILGDAPPPRGESLLSITGEQVRVFSEHTRFLVAGQVEGNVANVRLHSEHLVNIAYGKPIEELDGDGAPSNPGDGIGLLGRDNRPGHIPEVAELAGEGISGQATALEVAIRASAEEARICATSRELAEAEACVSSIEGRSARIDALWGEVREAASLSAVVPLERQ